MEVKQIKQEMDNMRHSMNKFISIQLAYLESISLFLEITGHDSDYGDEDHCIYTLRQAINNCKIKDDEV
jgi:hypothetical protein